mmetsp:Transcript_65353/g.143304  ORF Transcript_65353/g.143304 Transcript_65353/m.143304 type:complete len:151 (-) Transcript_65353:1-453(-)
MGIFFTEDRDPTGGSFGLGGTAPLGGRPLTPRAAPPAPLAPLAASCTLWLLPNVYSLLAVDPPVSSRLSAPLPAQVLASPGGPSAFPSALPSAAEDAGPNSSSWPFSFSALPDAGGLSNTLSDIHGDRQDLQRQLPACPPAPDFYLATDS